MQAKALYIWLAQQEFVCNSLHFYGLMHLKILRRNHSPAEPDSLDEPNQQSLIVGLIL